MLPDEQVLVARGENVRVVGVAAAADFGQVFDGEVLPMGGVTGVVVAPEASGRGVARQLMASLIRLMDERGNVVSLLSPSTSPLYRSVGYETANTLLSRAVPVRDLRSDTPSGVTVTTAGTEVFDEYRALHDAHARRSHGWLIRDEWYWSWKKRRAETSDSHVRVFVAHRAEAAIAVAVVGHRADSKYPFADYDYDIIDIFGEPDGLTAIAATLRSQSTLAGYLRTTMTIADLPSILDRPELCEIEHEDPMMGRVLDVARACRMRGGGHFEGSLHLEVHDDILSANDGRFVIEWSGESLSVERGGSGVVEITINDLAPLLTGFQTPVTLAAQGRLGRAITDDVVRRMSRWLACPTPTAVDGF